MTASVASLLAGSSAIREGTRCRGPHHPVTAVDLDHPVVEVVGEGNVVFETARLTTDAPDADAAVVKPTPAALCSAAAVRGATGGSARDRSVSMLNP